MSLNNNQLCFIILSIIAVLIIWFLYIKSVKIPKETFQQNAKQDVLSNEQLNKKNPPFVDTQVGTLMDGPGFEKPSMDTLIKKPSVKLPSNYYFLDDGANGEFSIQHNLCSKSCCSEQWPTPFKQKYDPYVCNNKDKFVPSNYFCNNTFQDSGCLCLTKSQASFLYNRGGNGRELF